MDDEYVFIPVDLTGIWQRRINAIYIDVYLAESVRDFDICFAGMFRSVNEACAYASDWLEPICGIGGETSAYPDQDCPGAPTEPPVAEPPYDPPVSTDPPEIWGTIPEEAITEVISRGGGCPGHRGGRDGRRGRGRGGDPGQVRLFGQLGSRYPVGYRRGDAVPAQKERMICGPKNRRTYLFGTFPWIVYKLLPFFKKKQLQFWRMYGIIIPHRPCNA